jgi:hypothetical protein
MTELKLAYLRRQGQTRAHPCHWPGCAAQIPPALWGCATHWRQIPAALKTKLLAAYHPGQENWREGAERPSRAYLEVAMEVRQWILHQGMTREEKVAYQAMLATVHVAHKSGHQTGTRTERPLR